MRSSLIVVAALVVAMVQAPSSVASPIPPIIVPAGDGFILSGAQAGGCDDVTYGYEIGAAPNQTLASKPAASCPTSQFPRVAVPAQTSVQSLRIWLADTTCVSSLASAPTYYSDGTSTGTSPSVNHALLSGNGPYNVTMNDAGGACPGTVQNSNAIPSGPDQGNFRVNVTITTPPTVVITAPAPSSGTNGYFDAQDVSAGGGAVTVQIAARDNSTTGMSSVACTDNGSALTLSTESAPGGASMTGSVSVSSDGTHNVVCTGTDNNRDIGSASPANLMIDTTLPVLSLPGSPVTVQGASTGRTLSSFPVSAADPDAGDSATVSCNPMAPHTFPVGSTTVSCIATDRAGNTTAGSFTVRVALPATLSLTGASASGPAASVSLACHGIAGQECAGRVTATVVEHKHAGTLNAATAQKRKHPGKPKTPVATVTVAGASFSVPAGATQTVRLTLNRTGSLLLKRLGKLAVKLAVTGIEKTPTLVLTIPRLPLAVSTPPDSWFSTNPSCSNCYTYATYVPITGLPNGARVTVICRGAGCPFTERATTPLGGRINLASVLGDSHLRPGTKVQVVISAPLRIGEVLTYTMQRGAPPARTESAAK
jgi:hypothetical protein